MIERRKLSFWTRNKKKKDIQKHKEKNDVAKTNFVFESRVI